MNARVPHSSHWGAFDVELDDGRVAGVTPFEHDRDPSPLLESIPGIDGARRRRLQAIAGTIPSALSPPSGCRFHPRCPMAIDDCRKIDPPLQEKRPGHYAACIRV